MSEPYTLDFLGRMLREMQADMRTLRSENGLVRRELGERASRAEVANMLAALGDRMAAFEARMERRFDQTERSIEERLIRIEAKLDRT